YLLDFGYRASPYVTWGAGAVLYGNEWGGETGGGLLVAGVGVEVEVSRLAVLGIGFVYRPTLLAAWKDTAGQERPLGVAQFVGGDLILEVRLAVGRRRCPRSAPGPARQESYGTFAPPCGGFARARPVLFRRGIR